MMKLWRIYQDQNNNYDTFDSAIVAADTIDNARATNPYGDIWPKWSARGTWCGTPESVGAICIGEAVEGTEPGVILASFNAG